MRPPTSSFLRRLALACLAAPLLAGCASTPGYRDQPGAHRCDRNGDIYERKAC
jgi:hypothetical protein